LSKLILIAAVPALSSALLADQVDDLFEQFKHKFHKKYGSIAEELSRKTIFHDSMKRADTKNALNGSPIFGVTKFSDLTQEEFNVNLGRKGHGFHDEDKEHTFRATKVPKSELKASTLVDWAAAGKTTPVKNQGQCGTCWAFSTTEQIESAWLMAGNAPWEFSVQQIASCDTTSNGCGGGDTINAYEYIMGNGVGLGSDAFAPYVQSMYTACNGPRCTNACSNYNLTALQQYESLTGPYAVLSGYTYATPPCSGASKCAKQDLATLAANVASYGPASVCVNAANWNDYTGGVMTTSACGSYAYRSLDHCVQLTGYNSEAETPYWIVRNSWATNWGENGYIYLQFDDNTCGVADEATFVDLA